MKKMVNSILVGKNKIGVVQIHNEHITRYTELK